MIPGHLALLLDEGVSLDGLSSESLSSEGQSDGLPGMSLDAASLIAPEADNVETCTSLPHASEMIGNDSETSSSVPVKRHFSTNKFHTKVDSMEDEDLVTENIWRPKKKIRQEDPLAKFALDDIQKQKEIVDKYPIFKNITFSTRSDLFNSMNIIILEKFKADEKTLSDHHQK